MLIFTFALGEIHVVSLCGLSLFNLFLKTMSLLFSPASGCVCVCVCVGGVFIWLSVCSLYERECKYKIAATSKLILMRHRL